MGGTSSTPASPEASPNMGMVRRAYVTQRGPGPGSSPLSTNLKPFSGDQDGKHLSRYPGTSSKHAANPCPSTGDEGDDDEDDECDDDEDDEDDDCDDDEDDDDECEEEEDEEDFCEDDEEEEDDREKQAYNPCREPSKNEKDVKNETISDGSKTRLSTAFSPCRDRLPNQENSQGTETVKKQDTAPNKQAYSPCREPSMDVKSGRDHNQRKPGQTQAAFSRCRDPARQGSVSPKNIRSAQTVLEKKEVTGSDVSVSSMPPSAGQMPSRESKKEGQENRPLSFMFRNFKPCRDQPTAETSPKKNKHNATPSAVSESNVQKAACKDEKPNSSESEAETNPQYPDESRVGTEKASDCDDSENSLNTGVRSETDPSISQGNQSETPKKDEKTLYEKNIKELQKGCAYLSRKELRKVCDKYKSYGYVKETCNDILEKTVETADTDSELYCVGFSQSRESLGTSDYSGATGPCTPDPIFEASREMVSLTNSDRQNIKMSFMEAAEKSGLKSFASTEYTANSAAKMETPLHSGQYKEGNTEQVLKKINFQSEGQDKLKNIQEDNANKESSTTRKSRWQSRTNQTPGYTIISNRTPVDQTRSLSLSQHRSNSDGGHSEKLTHGDKTNSNNTCLHEETNSESLGYEETAAVERAHSDEDDLWFDCLEDDFKTTVQARNYDGSEDNFYFVDDFIECNIFTEDSSLSRKSRESGIFFTDGVSLNNHESLRRYLSRGLDFPLRQTLRKHSFGNIIDGNKFDFTKSQVDQYDLAISKVRENKNTHHQATPSHFWSLKDTGINEPMARKNPQYVRSETQIECRVTSKNVLTFCLADHPRMMIRKNLLRSDENINSNADSLLHHKKQSSKDKSVGQSPNMQSVNPIDAASTSAGRLHEANNLNGNTALDSDLAGTLGLSHSEIQDLTSSIHKTPEYKYSSLHLFRKAIFDVDLARDMGLTREQVKILIETLSYDDREESVIFDVELATKLGLDETEMEKLNKSASPLNRAKFMLMMGEAPFHPALALSMGLSAEELEKLIESSLQTSRITIGKVDSLEPYSDLHIETPDGHVPFDEALAESFGLTKKQIRKLANSSDPRNTPSTKTFSIYLAKYMGLDDEQIKQLTESSLKIMRANAEKRFRIVKNFGLIDKQLASEMGLSEDQIMKLEQNSTRRMLGQSMFDPYLALQLGLSTKQIKQLADTVPDQRKVPRAILNRTVAKSLGLSDSQIKALEESSVSSRSDFDPLMKSGEQLVDFSALKALGLNSQEIKQLLASIVSRDITQVQSMQPTPPKSGPFISNNVIAQGQYSPKNPQGTNNSKPEAAYERGLNLGVATPKYRPGPPVAYHQRHIVGDGVDKKDHGFWKRRLVCKLDASVSSGDKVNDILTTLVEWNSILLVVVFLLLLATSCPKATRAFLPCPLPATCQFLHRYIISPLGIDQMLKDSPFAGDEESDDQPKLPPRGVLYTLLYRAAKATGSAVMEVSSFAYSNILVPILNIPIQVGVPFLELMYTCLSCALQKIIYFLFFACGSFLGIPVPSSLAALRQESQGRVHTKPEVSSFCQETDETKTPLTRREESASDEREAQERPYSGSKESSEMQPFSHPEPEPVAPNLQNLHQYGGFLFYVGFDPPKKGCNYSAIPSFFLWLLWSLPEECA